MFRTGQNYSLRFALAAVMLAAVASPALAQPESGISEWDRDGDGMLDAGEVERIYDSTGAFDDLDEDGDGMLSAREMESDGEDRNYSERDVDSNNVLTRDEFNSGAFREYDLDVSERIEAPEFENLQRSFTPRLYEGTAGVESDALRRNRDADAGVSSPSSPPPSTTRP